MNRYVPTGASAAGGIGIVSFCTDTNLDRRVAIKYLGVDGEHRRILDELQALQRIRSKHVVQIYDVVYERDGTLMGIVEEYVTGDSLEEHLGRLSPDESFVKLVYQMASGIADIHDVNVIHRDVKPANIKIDNENILKVIDFNLARDVKDGKTRGFVGTRGYAAPEQYSASVAVFGREVDVYALGVVAWALLNGERLPQELRVVPPRPDEWTSAGGGFVALDSGLDDVLMTLLDAAVSSVPGQRPLARAIADRAGRVLLRGKHRAVLVNRKGQAYKFETGTQSATVRNSFASATIHYDLMDFRLVKVSGEVWINNLKGRTGMRLPDGCVLTLGDPVRGISRSFLPFDVSHPEVVL